MMRIVLTARSYRNCGLSRISALTDETTLVQLFVRLLSSGCTKDDGSSPAEPERQASSH